MNNIEEASTSFSPISIKQLKKKTDDEEQEVKEITASPPKAQVVPPRKALKKSSRLLGDISECNEVELLNLFEQAEHYQNIVLMLKVLNRLLEFKNVYFDFMHRTMNIYHKFGIVSIDQALMDSEDIYVNYTHLIDLFKYLIEIGDSTSFKSHTCDTIGVCLFTIFSKLNIDEFGYIETVYINSENASETKTLLTKSHVFEKSINYFKQALSNDKFDTTTSKIQCYRHLQEVFSLFGEFCTSHKSYDNATENYLKAIEFIKIEYHMNTSNSQNIKEFIKSNAVYKRVKRNVQFDFPEQISTSTLVKIDHCVSSSQIIPACSCFSCK